MPNQDGVVGHLFQVLVVQVGELRSEKGRNLDAEQRIGKVSNMVSSRFELLERKFLIITSLLHAPIERKPQQFGVFWQIPFLFILRVRNRHGFSITCVGRYEQGSDNQIKTCETQYQFYNEQ